MLKHKKKTYTYADFEKLPEGAPYQLIGGDLLKSPPPVPYHQGLGSRLHIHFITLEEAGKGKVYLSPIGVYLSETETYQPDLLFISADRYHIIGAKKIEGAPDIVVEILSPSSAYYDLRSKKNVYEQSGVKEYWIVDPMEKSIELYSNTDEGFVLKERRKSGTIASALYPELEISVERLFREADVPR